MLYILLNSTQIFQIRSFGNMGTNRVTLTINIAFKSFEINALTLNDDWLQFHNSLILQLFWHDFFY